MGGRGSGRKAPSRFEIFASTLLSNVNAMLLKDFWLAGNLVSRVSIGVGKETLVAAGHVALLDKHFSTWVGFSLYFDPATCIRLRRYF